MVHCPATWPLLIILPTSSCACAYPGPSQRKAAGHAGGGISGGSETHPIPVINDKDSTGPPQIHYIRSVAGITWQQATFKVTHGNLKMPVSLAETSTSSGVGDIWVSLAASVLCNHPSQCHAWPLLSLTEKILTFWRSSEVISSSTLQVIACLLPPER